MSGRKCCFGNPKFLCAEEPGFFFKLLVPALVSFGGKRSCLSLSSTLAALTGKRSNQSEDDTKIESVQKETHFSNLGQR